MIVEVISWNIECNKNKDGPEWLKARETGVEYSRVCKDGLAK